MTEERVIIRETAVPHEFVLVSRLVFYLTDVVEVGLLLRFILKALAADPGNAFASLLYTITQPLVRPFQGIFPSTAASGLVLEWASLLAMAVYALIALLIVRLFRIILVR
jgi:YggT family protein